MCVWGGVNVYSALRGQKSKVTGGELPDMVFCKSILGHISSPVLTLVIIWDLHMFSVGGMLI